jgi:hypothetical protein
LKTDLSDFPSKGQEEAYGKIEIPGVHCFSSPGAQVKDWGADIGYTLGRCRPECSSSVLGTNETMRLWSYI